MAWVAMDRVIRGAEEFNLPGRLDQWRVLRQRIHDSVCREGYNAEKQSFVQYYGGDELDASLLLLPLVGFLPPEDPRIKGTVAAIQRELTVDGLVLRYRTHEARRRAAAGRGRVPGVQLLAGRQPGAARPPAGGAALFERLLGLRNDVGLLAEEYDPRARRQLGNFPQAFSHLALINTAMNLHNHGPAHRRRSG